MHTVIKKIKVLFLWVASHIDSSNFMTKAFKIDLLVIASGTYKNFRHCFSLWHTFAELELIDYSF
jgi:hypothetical protein